VRNYPSSGLWAPSSNEALEIANRKRRQEVLKQAQVVQAVRACRFVICASPGVNRALKPVRDLRDAVEAMHSYFYVSLTECGR
jgi:hypothetical protein